MKNIFLLFLLSTSFSFSQSRNNQVRLLNSIVYFMDESSRVNRNLYLDIKQFAEGYIHSSGAKQNNNYWYTLSSPTMKIGSFDNAQAFPELHVDNEKMVIHFEYNLYPYLQVRDTMNKLLATKFFYNKEDVKLSLLDFRSTIDSLVIMHRAVYDYVTNKAYLSDADFKIALNYIDVTSHILDNYHAKAARLFASIRNCFNDLLKPSQKQPTILYAEKEMYTIINLMDKWEDKLFKGDSSFTVGYDSLLHKYNTEGMLKDSVFFYGTYGYKVSRNGAMPHTRFCIFYNMMKATLFWYAKDKYYYQHYIKRADITYNQYIDRTHMVIEDYNDLIECADGKQLTKNNDYSMKMGVEIGMDTNQNVLLNKPRWGYLFHFVKPGEKQPIIVEKKDTNVSLHQQMINHSLPHQMVFLLDVSASMHNPGKLDLLKNGAKYLVSLQRQSDYISLLTFSTHSHTVIKNISCDHKNLINTKIDELQAHGASNASDGIRNAFGIADSNVILNGKNKIILVTDGKFQLDVAATKLLNEFKKKKAELIILLIGTKEDAAIDKVFERICKKGNGRFYRVNEKNVEDILIKEASN